MKILILINLVLASILVGLLTSCTARGPVTVKHGKSTITVAANAALGAKTFQHFTLNKNGTLSFTTRDDGEAVAGRALDVAGVAYGGYLMAGVQEAKDASDAAVAIGAQKAGTAEAGIAAGVATEAIKAETTKVITIPK